MDIDRSIRLAVDSGKVTLGSQKSIKHALNGDAKLLVLAENCPETVADDVKEYCKLSEIRVVRFPGTSVKLGTVCGKPFPVSVLSVIEEGDSDILNVESPEG
ncbi:50S ribosomal protein L30e [Candidatus Micrarchaeota archaeon]|nr:50S ribosomal protein L30e [Candidatus Micrarchaeota archaeon]